MWKLSENGVTKSFIDSFCQCPWQTKLRYVDGWKPKVYPKNFLFGSIMHHALEEFYLTPKDFEKHWFNAEKICGAFFDKNVRPGYGFMGNDTIEEYEHIKDIAIATFRAYITFNRAIVKEPQGVEQVFKVNYDGTYLNGMYDLVYSSPEGDEIWDHKTKSQINVEKEEANFIIDTQIHLYSLAYFLQTGNIPKFKYNIIRQPANRPKKDFITHMEKAILEKPNYYFLELEIKLTEAELVDWKRDFLDLVIDRISLWERSGYLWPGYYNPTTLVSPFGKSEFFDAIVYDDYSGLTRKVTPFEELERE